MPSHGLSVPCYIDKEEPLMWLVKHFKFTRDILYNKLTNLYKVAYA